MASERGVTLAVPAWGGGVLSTAGGLVFGGSDEGFFFALDSATGKPLWRFQTGGKIVSNPISYLSEGKQRVAIAAGLCVAISFVRPADSSTAVRLALASWDCPAAAL